MIEIRLAEAAGDSTPGQPSAPTIFDERFSSAGRCCRRSSPTKAAPAGAADRRARPHRRAVRGLSARGALRLPGDHPRDRHDQGGPTADRHHLQPHARDPRRLEAALLLSLGRLSPDAERELEILRVKAPGSTNALSRQVWSFVQEPRQGPVSVARRSPETIDWTDGADRARLGGASTRRRSTTRWACCSNTRTTSSACRARKRPRSCAR